MMKIVLEWIETPGTGGGAPAQLGSECLGDDSNGMPISQFGHRGQIEKQVEPIPRADNPALFARGNGLIELSWKTNYEKLNPAQLASWTFLHTRKCRRKGTLRLYIENQVITLDAIVYETNVDPLGQSGDVSYRAIGFEV